jgi:hypothetical protein
VYVRFWRGKRGVSSATDRRSRRRQSAVHAERAERASEQSEQSNHYSMITNPLRRGSAPPPSGLRADTPPKYGSRWSAIAIL